MAAVRGVNASSYVKAGNAAINNAITTIKAARDNAPKYDEIAMEGRVARSKEKQAAFNAQAKVAQAGIRAEAAVREARIEADRDKSLAKSKMTIRKAGVVAAAGELIGDALTKDDYKEFKPFVPDRSGTEKLINQMLNDANTELEEATNSTYEMPDSLKPEPDSSTPTNTNSGSGESSGSSPTSTGNVTPSKLLPHQTKGLAAIRRVESDAYGGYNAYNLGGKTEFDPVGSGNSSDGKQFGKPLTSMTIGEIRQLGASGKIHATGAYQFTHNTGSFGEAVSFAGLSDDDYFTPDNQDKMALAFGRKYGWDRWSGLKLDSQARDEAIAGFK